MKSEKDYLVFEGVTFHKSGWVTNVGRAGSNLVLDAMHPKFGLRQHVFVCPYVCSEVVRGYAEACAPVE